MATPKRRSTSSKVDRAKLAKSKIKSVDKSFEHLKALFYAQNGKGKTYLGASGPRKVLIVDCNERGTLSVSNFKGVDVFPVEVWTDIDLAYWHLHSAEHQYQTVVIDTVTSLAQLCMKFVLGDEASRDPTKDPEMPTKRDWGKVGELMRTVILNFRNLDMHVVFLAQERRGFTDDEDSDAPEVFPEVSPSIRTTLTASVDIIGRLYVKEVTRKGEGDKKQTVPSYRMQVGPSERYTTKNRVPRARKLPPVIQLGPEEDNLAKLIERIKKGE